MFGEESINRIRLEFKDKKWQFNIGDRWVLIESDWNLKLINGSIAQTAAQRINRIRLEFKVL